MSRCVWHLLILFSLLVFVPPAFAQERGACDGSHASLALPTKSKIHLFSRHAGRTFLLDVEVALTREETAHGLMGRTVMPAGTGMLFLFDPPREIAFWMKDTCVPLDMIFVRNDGTIIKVVQETKPLDLTPISSDGEIGSVLEIKGGEARRMGLKAGDKLILDRGTK